MRLFVALEIPDGIRDAASRLIEQMRPAAAGARWSRADGIHITLKFIGHIKPELLQPIEAALEKICFDQPVNLKFRGLGFFPNEHRPHVFWVGVQASPITTELSVLINQRLEPLGIARETRDFSPHLTLARLEDIKPAALLAEIEKLGPVDLGEMTTSEFHLFESKPQRGGSLYTRLKSFQFVDAIAGRAQVGTTAPASRENP